MKVWSDQLKLACYDELTPEASLLRMNACRSLARVYNSLNVESLEGLFALHCSMKGQSSEDDHDNREDTIQYFKGRLQFVIESDWPFGFEVGVVDSTIKEEPVVIIEIEGQREVLWAPRVNDQGLITDVMVYRVLPHPYSATSLKETPGFDHDEYDKRLTKIWEGRKKIAQELDGPLHFVGITMPDLLPDDMEKDLHFLCNNYPGSTYELHIQDKTSTDNDDYVNKLFRQIEAPCWPAMAIMRSGKVIRSAQLDSDNESVCKDLKRMGFLSKLEKGLS